MEKIEHIQIDRVFLTKAQETMTDKINEIIDRLNEQPEERMSGHFFNDMGVCVRCGLNKEEVQLSGLGCEDEDTPEQTELVEKLRDVYLVGEGVTLGYYEDMGGEDCINDIVEIFEHLLEEREREGYEKGIKWCTETMKEFYKLKGVEIWD